MKTVLPLSLFLIVVQCHGQGTITFDGSPVQSPGTAKLVQEYIESGIWFIPLSWSDGFVRRGAQPRPGWPDNGTAYLQASLGDSLRFGSMSGDVFNMESVDLAEYSDVVPDAVTVRFVGYRHDGTIVTTDLKTDGIMDAGGPLADFQTFYFDSHFTGLDRVEIPTYGWALDNLVISIPEPGIRELMILGTVLMSLRFLKRKSPSVLPIN